MIQIAITTHLQYDTASVLRRVMSASNTQIFIIHSTRITGIPSSQSVHLGRLIHSVQQKPICWGETLHTTMNNDQILIARASVAINIQK